MSNQAPRPENSFSANRPPPFLAPNPPPLAVRSVAAVLLVSFASAVVLASVIEIPVTVSGAFSLVPQRGADPLRAPRSGIVAEVAAMEGESVRAGDLLVTIRSQALAEQAGEKQSIGLGMKSAEARIKGEKRRHESQVKVDEEEKHRLEQRMASISRQTVNTKKEITFAEQLAQQAKDAREQGVGTVAALVARQMDVVRAQGELLRLEGDLSETRSSLTRLSREMDVRERDLEEFERGKVEDIERAKLRAATIEDSPVQGEGNRVSLKAPCHGIVVRQYVKAKGAVVAEGDALVEIVCEGEALEADIAVEGSGFGLVRKDQPIKLYYDAFPHQRHGTRRADVRWIGPSGGGERPKLRILATVRDDAFVAGGQTYPLMAGMAGRAEIIVDRRTPIGYLFGPVRELREGLTP